MSDLVNFELAKKLKEKGFREKVNAYYGKHENIFDVHLALDMNDCDYRASAPTIYQVLKWLRKVKKISIEVNIHCSLKWMCSIYGFSDGISDFTQYNHDGIDDTVFILYPSYEAAALAGIEYVLDNLI